MQVEKIISYIMFLIILALYLVRVMVQQYVISSGFELMAVMSQVDRQSAENSRIRNEILSYQSLRVIKEEALRMGFQDSVARDTLWLKN